MTFEHQAPDRFPEPPEPSPEKAAGPSWGPVDAFIGIGLLVPLTGATALALYAIGLVAYYLAVGTRPPVYFGMLMIGLGSFLSTTALVWLLGIKKSGAKLRDLGVTNIRWFFDTTAAVLGEIVVFIALATYSIILIKLFNLQVPEQPVVEMFGRSNIGFALAVVVIVILAPIGEELFFRGFVYQSFKSRWGVGVGMAASSAIFALFHLVPLLYVPMFVIGMALVILFEYRGSLAPNIMLHMVNNLLALAVAYSSVG